MVGSLLQEGMQRRKGRGCGWLNMYRHGPGRHEGGQLQEVVMKRTFATADLRAFVHIPGCTEDEGD